MHPGAARSLPAADRQTPISILKPLSGLDEGLADNLRSYFRQDYSNFELLFAVRQPEDRATRVVRQLMAEYPDVPAQLFVTGEPPYPHAKVFSLHCMLQQARHDLLAMCDSDVRVGPDFCLRLADEFREDALGLVTCPYRAVAGRSIWSQLEAVGMNTDFAAGLFTAVLMEGTKFAVGPTIVARRSVLLAVGGIERVKDYLAEDYMLGRLASELGVGVALSPYVVEHRIGSESMAVNFAHRLRWNRSTRRSRPAGYVGEFFTHPLPLCLCVVWLLPSGVRIWAWVITLVLRGTLAWIVCRRILGARVRWALLPLQDLLGFGFWFAGFFGNSINWRGQRYLLKKDGTIELAR